MIGYKKIKNMPQIGETTFGLGQLKNKKADHPG